MTTSCTTAVAGAAVSATGKGGLITQPKALPVVHTFK